MEPEPTTHTVATNDLPAKFRSLAGGAEADGQIEAWSAYMVAARIAEASLRAESAAHEETARELVRAFANCTPTEAREILAATLASVRRATLKRAADAIEDYAHGMDEPPFSDLLHVANMVRNMAVAPAAAPTPEHQRERSG